MKSLDFETTTDINDCRVWAWGLCDIFEINNFICGNNIESFFEYIKDKNEKYYIHNLKFDGEFILSYLLKNKFKWVKNRNDLIENCFTTLISDRGVFYSIEICFKKTHHTTYRAILYDSLKLFPMSVDEIGKAFNLPIQKLTLDYNKYRSEGHILTETEINYLKHDVQIVAMAIQELHKQNLTKLTTASNALYSFKDTIGEKKFKKYFPILPYELDQEMRPAYKGGFTYLNPKYKNKSVGKGLTLDVNSLYPSVMYSEYLPYGIPIKFDGEYKYDRTYNIYIQSITCKFYLKKDGIPTIQLKNNFSFCSTEYLTSSVDKMGVDNYVTLFLTNIDLKLFFENYEVKELVYNYGYKFKSTNKLFKNYIDYWTEVKINATKEGNTALRTIAKLMLNSLYGKFALNPNICGKIPYLENGVVKYKNDEKEIREPIYLPIGIFVTSYARNKTIRTCKRLGDRFIYADTDSAHIVGEELPQNIEIDDYKLGAWKIEEKFKRGKYIRAKTYIEDVIHDKEIIEKFITNNSDLKHLCSDDSILKITCAGLPVKCYKYITWDNFKKGQSYKGKLQMTHVKNGIVLQEIEFTIK